MSKCHHVLDSALAEMKEGENVRDNDQTWYIDSNGVVLYVCKYGELIVKKSSLEKTIPEVVTFFDEPLSTLEFFKKREV